MDNKPFSKEFTFFNDMTAETPRAVLCSADVILRGYGFAIRDIPPKSNEFVGKTGCFTFPIVTDVDCDKTGLTLVVDYKFDDNVYGKYRIAVSAAFGWSAVASEIKDKSASPIAYEHFIKLLSITLHNYGLYFDESQTARIGGCGGKMKFRIKYIQGGNTDKLICIDWDNMAATAGVEHYVA